MINYIKKLFNSQNNAQTNQVEGPSTNNSGKSLAAIPTLQFKVYSANGGIIINFFNEFDVFISKTPNEDSSLYIVKDGDDLAKKISQIIDIELVQRKRP